MFKHLEGARLGLFIFLGTVLLVVAIFLVGNKDSLFVQSIFIKTYFSNIEGLRTGASVRLSGLTIGSVSDIQLREDSTRRVEVIMRIEKNIQQFIRLDSKAAIETEGLIGSKIIVLTPGSRDQEIISNGGIIKAEAPVNMMEIIKETQSIMAYVKDLTKDFSQIVAKINSGQGTIGKIINDEDMYNSTVEIIKSADQSLLAITTRLDQMSDFVINLGGGIENIIKNVDSAAADISGLVSRVERGEGVLGALISDGSAYDSIKTVIHNLARTTAAAKEGTESFAENMEALKHNWLFKNYFEERGYWSKEIYERDMDIKIEEFKKQQKILEEKINELQKLEVRINELKEQ